MAITAQASLWQRHRQRITSSSGTIVNSERTPEQEEPKQGTCSTCIGIVDDTLGSCSATANCVSSFDDRPKFFIAPWEFPGGLKTAVSNLQEALQRTGTSIKEKSERMSTADGMKSITFEGSYLREVNEFQNTAPNTLGPRKNEGEDGVSDDVEFLFSDPTEDATVEPLELWVYESSPFCKIAREALSELELPHLSQLCSRKRREGLGATEDWQISGAVSGARILILMQRCLRVTCDIVEYVRKTYALAPA